MTADTTPTEPKQRLRVVAGRQPAARGGATDPAAGPEELGGAAVRPQRKVGKRAPVAPDRVRRIGDTPVRPTGKPASGVKAGRIAAKRKRRTALISFLVVVGIPALLASLYFGFLASNQYHAEARFAVRGAQSPVPDMIGLLTGAPGGSGSGDSYILQQYILSREMVEAVQKSVDVEAIFNRPEADYIARLGHDKPIEKVVDYWDGMVSAAFDPYSGIISLEVRAFRPEDAQVLASAIVKESDILVNRLADKARADAIAFAQKELEFAEWRLQDARRELTDFQSIRSTFDPSATATANQELVGKLQAKLADAESELTGLLTLVGPEAPPARVLKTRIAALQAQIEAERGKIGGGDSLDTPGADKGLSGQVADFEGLKTSEEFAQQIYLSALKGLETARADAKRNHSYLATFVSPMLPQYAIYPERLNDTLLVILIAFGVWAIGGLFYAAVRDHLA